MLGPREVASRTFGSGGGGEATTAGFGPEPTRHAVKLSFATSKLVGSWRTILRRPPGPPG